MEILIIALPLLASIISGFFGKFIGDRNSEIVTSFLVTISAILSIIVFYEVIFNGSTKNFINIMENRSYKLNTQKKVWVLE